MLLTLIQGARWDVGLGSLQNSKLKELHPQMPVIHIKAVTQETFVSFTPSHLSKVEIFYFEGQTRSQQVRVSGL